jgi:tetratricopeptide (TPR) repeat protein
MSTRLDELRLLLEEDPNDVFVKYAIAMECYKIGEVETAIHNLGALLNDAPDYLPAYFRLGQWYAEQDAFDSARSLLLKGLELAKAQKDIKAIAEIQELLALIEDYEN